MRERGGGILLKVIKQMYIYIIEERDYSSGLVRRIVGVTINNKTV